MATASLSLIKAIRKTANKLENGADYQWGHMGSCNCGNLVQELTLFDNKEIHRFAMERSGDWNEQLNDYCPDSGLPMDIVIDRLIDAGLSLSDLKHLERLSDPLILKELPGGNRYLKYNNRKDVILYLLTWADILEFELLKKIEINPLEEISIQEAAQ